MTIGEFGYFISKYIFYSFVFISSIYGSYAVYYAYAKSKDEREKYIVMKSVSYSFGTSILFFFIYYVIQLSVEVSNIERLTQLWNILHFGENTQFSAGTAVSTMMMFLGIFLFLGKRKAGGD